MVNPVDELELDVLAATGDIEAAETAGWMARELMNLCCYMLGMPPQAVRIELIARMSNATP